MANSEVGSNGKMLPFWQGLWRERMWNWGYRYVTSSRRPLLGYMSDVSEKWAMEDLRLTLELLWGMDDTRALAKMSLLDWELHKTTYCVPVHISRATQFPQRNEWGPRNLTWVPWAQHGLDFPHPAEGLSLLYKESRFFLHAQSRSSLRFSSGLRGNWFQ